MLGAALKLLALYFINRRILVAKSGLDSFKEELADYTESRAQLIKDNCQADLVRIVNSFIGFLVILAALIFTGILGLMWLFVIAWSSPHRDIILAVCMLIPLLIGLITFLMIRSSWKKKPLMIETGQMIANDWKSFRHGTGEATNITEEATQ